MTTARIVIIAAVVNHESYTDIMNLPNRGQTANLPADVVVETFGDEMLIANRQHLPQLQTD